MKIKELKWKQKFQNVMNFSISKKKKILDDHWRSFFCRTITRSHNLFEICHGSFLHFVSNTDLKNKTKIFYFLFMEITLCKLQFQKPGKYNFPKDIFVHLCFQELISHHKFHSNNCNFSCWNLSNQIYLQKQKKIVWLENFWFEKKWKKRERKKHKQMSLPNLGQ